MADLDDFRPGDVIKARRLGVFWHFGVYEGGESVIVLLAGSGIARQALARFANGGELRLVDEFAAGRLDRRTTLARARGLVDLPFRYSLAGNNCEHFARWCATGRAESRQVGNAALAAGVVAAAAVAVIHRPWIVAGAALVATFTLVEAVRAKQPARAPFGPAR